MALTRRWASRAGVAVAFGVSIFHIAEKPVWEAAQASGQYRVPSLELEGFIHLSTREQFVATANRYYVGRSNLALLEVNEAELPVGALKYEESTNNELFPHLYETLPVAAVVGVHIFEAGPDGLFVAPEGL